MSLTLLNRLFASVTESVSLTDCLSEIAHLLVITNLAQVVVVADIHE